MGRTIDTSCRRARKKCQAAIHRLEEELSQSPVSRGFSGGDDPAYQRWADRVRRKLTSQRSRLLRLRPVRRELLAEVAEVCASQSPVKRGWGLHTNEAAR